MKKKAKSEVTIPSQLLTIDEVAKILHVGVRTAHRMKAVGILPPAIRLPALRFSARLIQKWIDDGCKDCRKGWTPEAGSR